MLTVSWLLIIGTPFSFHVSENALMTFGSESDQQPTPGQISTTSKGRRENQSSTSQPETIETTRNLLDTVIPTQVGRFPVMVTMATSLSHSFYIPHLLHSGVMHFCFFFFSKLFQQSFCQALETWIHKCLASEFINEKKKEIQRISLAKIKEDILCHFIRSLLYFLGSLNAFEVLWWRYHTDTLQQISFQHVFAALFKAAGFRGRSQTLDSTPQGVHLLKPVLWIWARQFKGTANAASKSYLIVLSHSFWVRNPL